MPRLSTLAFLLLGAAAAQAQQVAPAAPTHSLLPDTTRRDSTRTARGGRDLIRCAMPQMATLTVVEWPSPPTSSIQPVLSRIPGVQVTPYSGAPGAWATVRLRGVTNVTGNEQPLYVVDGVPVYNTDVTPERWPIGPLPFSIFTTTPTPSTPTANPLLDLPMEEVEKIEVVYGAGATARYGMQGSSGAILITTRQGAGGRTVAQAPRVRYAGWVGVQQVRQRYALLNARQYANLANEAAGVRNQFPLYSAADLASLGELDWQDRRLRLAGITSHNLSLDGLTAHHTRYYVAADYLRQAGVVEQSGLTRYQLRANLDQQITTKLSLGLKASASQIDQYYAGTSPDAGNVLREALLAAPALVAGDDVPTQQFDFNSATPRTRRLVVQLSASYQFSPSLSLSLRGSREQAEARTLGFSRDYRQPTAAMVQTSNTTTSAKSWVADAALRYQHTFGMAHAVTVALTYQRQEFERNWGQELTSGSAFSTSKFSEKSRPVHSPAASLSYTYAGRYTAQAWLRYDFIRPSTDIAPEFQYRHWSPGGQLSWHLNKEAFLANANLNDLTLWAGAGKTGSSLASGAFFSFAPASITVQHDAGLRLGVLGGRLTLDVAAYQRRTRHAQTILRYQVPTSTGTSLFLSELPDIKLLNQGLTIALGSSWQWGTLSGTSQLAAATNRTEVEDLGFKANSTDPLANQGLEVGQPLGRYYVLEQDGTFPAGTPRAGQVRYRDRNHDGQGDYNDGYYTGSNLPRYTLSVFQQLRLRRFQLEAQFDGLFGYTILNSTLQTLDSPNGSTNSSPLALDRWTPTHQDTSVPQAGSYPPALTEQSLPSGNHIRLTQLTFSYEVLNRDTRKISVWVGGQNLFVTGSYRGYDPNVSSGGAAPLQAGQDASVYPVARVWQLGVRAGF